MLVDIFGKYFQEHRCAITDISTCRYDEITVSADSQGELIIWQKTVKGVNARILTKFFIQRFFLIPTFRQNINVINVLRKQVIVGTLRGLVQFYSVTSGNLMCEVNLIFFKFRNTLRVLDALAFEASQQRLCCSRECLRFDIFWRWNFCGVQTSYSQTTCISSK